MIRMVSWGIATTVVDAGRPGRAWLGAARGGAVDVVSHALANRLVGNPVDAGGLETSGGMSVQFDDPTMVAITGAVADVSVEHGPPVGWGSPVVLPPGAVIRIGRLYEGARLYLSVRGGLDAALVVGPDPSTAAATQPAARRPLRDSVRIWPGPRLDWFDGPAWSVLTSASFTVASTSRVGVRLSGPALVRQRDEELPSEGLVEGAVQVPPDGQPIVMLADHPVTGGYPVIAVVDPDDVARVAQATPGETLHFVRR